MVKEIEDSLRVSKEEREIDYSEDLIYFRSENNLNNIIKHLDKKFLILDQFENLIYLNLIEAIKTYNH